MRPALLLALASSFLLVGCDSTPDGPDLGDAYTVESRPVPLLDGDVLRVTVSYAGGCEEHTFTLGTQGGDELWLTHDANGDTCEASITEALAIPVPLDQLTGRPVYLYTSPTETLSLPESLR